MMDQRNAMAVLENLRGDAVVIFTMTAIPDWEQVSSLPTRDLPLWGAMGKASSIALGLALARPDLKVIVLDGDGSLLNNLGTLVTIAGKAPKNLCHFVLENGVYATTGGQPIPAQGLVSFAGLARAAGYAAVHEIDDLEDLTSSARDILAESGPVFVCLKVLPGIGPQEQGIPPREVPRPRTTRQAMTALRQSLGTA